MSSALSWISRFLGFNSLSAVGRDAYIIIMLRSLRMFTAGIPSLILALFFSSLNFSDSRIGVFMTLTLHGDVLLSLLLTLVADKLGRRRILFIGSLMMAGAGVAFALSENFWILLLAAVVGIISVTGVDCGPFRAIEESILSGLTDDLTRSDVLTWYVTATNMAGAIGSEVAGRAVHMFEKRSGDVIKAYHMLFWAYAAFGIIGSVLCLGLSDRCEAQEEELNEKSNEEEEALLEAMTPSTTDSFELNRNPLDTQNLQVKPPKKKSYFSQISQSTRSVMYVLWPLLALDSLADGMTPYSLMNYYVEQKFHLSKTTLGDITSASLFLLSIGSLLAGPLARRIGLIKTMVFTHLPSSIASGLIAVPRTVAPTVALMLVRAALNSMDQAPRSAFIAAVVKPQERTAVLGITTMLRTLAVSIGPSITGLLSGNGVFWIAFFATGACRITYDLGLWVLFVNFKIGRDTEKNEVDENEEA